MCENWKKKPKKMINLRTKETNRKLETWKEKNFFKRHVTKERTLRRMSKLESDKVLRNLKRMCGKDEQKKCCSWWKCLTFDWSSWITTSLKPKDILTTSNWNTMCE
jgi:hypothetical protein